MITPNEIRIGNILSHNGKRVSVLGIYPTEDMRGLDPLLHSHKIAVEDEYVSFSSKWISKFEPIPLNIGTLSLAGFKALAITEQKTIINDIDTLFVVSPCYHDAGVYEIIWDGAFTGRKISALHELQNHFYYFTGIEINKP